MPHITIEYSGNLDNDIDIGAVVDLVRHAAVETGRFPLCDIRVRAVRCEHFAIADGRDGLAFMAILLRFGEGRDLAARKKAGEHIFKVLTGYLDPLFAEDTFALSFEMQVVNNETHWERNSIHDLLISEARHG
jgi:5-carboxymethyl-2-hydroxymuconate isomerase